MGHGLLANNPVVLAAFQLLLRRRRALLVPVLLCLVIILAGLGVRAWSAASEIEPARTGGARDSEPRSRLLLRVAFGSLWIFDGARSDPAPDAVGDAHSGGAASGGGIATVGPARGVTWTLHLDLASRCRGGFGGWIRWVWAC